MDTVELDLPPTPDYEPNPNWHPAAQAVWKSAVESGQKVFWEPSDWAMLALICSQISQEYRDDLIVEKVKVAYFDDERETFVQTEELVREARPLPVGKLSAILKGLGSLGMTEMDRRRMSIELERHGKAPAQATPEEVRKAQLALIQGGRSGVAAG